MKRQYRLLSILLVLVVLVGFTPVVATASSSLPYVKVSTYQDNAKAKQVLKYINKERSKRGLSKVKLDKELTSAAVQRAAEVAIYIPTTSPHKRPNGKSAHGVNKRITSECCAEGYNTAESVVDGWMHSDAHRKLVLDKKARSVGIGCITTDGNDTFYALEISHTKMKKKLKSNKKVHSYKKVYAKKKYLKKSFFSLRTNLESDYYDGDEEEITITPGQKVKLHPYYSSEWNFYYNSRLAASNFKWSSSKKSVATVSKKGKVTGKSEGSVKITAKMKRYPYAKLTMWVDVTNDDDDYDY